MKTSTIFTLLLSSILSVAPIYFANACFESWEENVAHYRLFNQATISDLQFYPVLYNYHFTAYEPGWQFEDGVAQDMGDAEKANINDWEKYFSFKIKPESLFDIIYSKTIVDYDSIKMHLNDRSFKISSELSEDPLFELWKNNQYLPAFDYLYFAKIIETHTSNVQYWDQKNKHIQEVQSVGILSEHADVALEKAGITHDNFLRSRYAYQALKSYRYTNNTARAIEVYDQFLDTDTSNLLVKYWGLYHVAGMHQVSGDRAKGAYLLGKVFRNSPSKQINIKQDFRIENDSVWKAALALCNTNREKNNLWLITALKNKHAIVECMQEMTALDPSDPALEVLCARELEKFQKNYFPQRDFEHPYLYGGFKYEGDEFVQPKYLPGAELKDLIHSIINTGKMSEPAFWYSALALIDYINNDFDKCAIDVQNAELAHTTNKELQDQIRRIKILNKISAQKIIDAEFEESIHKDMVWLSEKLITKKYGYTHELLTYRNDAYRLCMLQLSKKYEAQNEIAKSFICYANFYMGFNFYYMPDEEKVTMLYEYMNSKSSSAFDKWLTGSIGISEDAVVEMLGTFSMRQNNWQEALTFFTKMSSPDSNKYFNLTTDPFKECLNDRKQCYDNNKIVMNKGDICKKMLHLEKLIYTDTTSLDSIYFLLGNAQYNMSYYGSSWRALDYFYCVSCDTYRSEEFAADIYGKFDCSLAEKYYLLAAFHTTDDEFAAKNCFMAAKCEQNKYYNSPDYSSYNANGKKRSYRNNFETLYSDYRSTDFYSQIINECKHFNYYVNTYH